MIANKAKGNPADSSGQIRTDLARPVWYLYECAFITPASARQPNGRKITHFCCEGDDRWTPIQYWTQKEQA